MASSLQLIALVCLVVPATAVTYFSTPYRVRCGDVVRQLDCPAGSGYTWWPDSVAIAGDFASSYTSNAIDLSAWGAGGSETCMQEIFRNERTAVDTTNTSPLVFGGKDGYCLTAGSWRIRFWFSENYQGVSVGGRQFSVLVNGQQALSSYDILANAGAYYKAVSRDFFFTLSVDTCITITARYERQRPKFSAFEILPGEWLQLLCMCMCCVCVLCECVLCVCVG